jgi:hypothetical protein
MPKVSNQQVTTDLVRFERAIDAASTTRRHRHLTAIPHGFRTATALACSSYRVFRVGWNDPNKGHVSLFDHDVEDHDVEDHDVEAGS